MLLRNKHWDFWIAERGVLEMTDATFEGELVRLVVIPDGDVGRHPADGVGPPPMARPDREGDIGRKERLVHSNLGSVREDVIGVSSELLDEAEDIVPSSTVEPS